jgi:hypothetical protein
MIVPSWLPECAISRPNQALVAAGEGAGQGPASKFNCPFWTQDPSALPHNWAFPPISPRVGPPDTTR